MYKQKYLFKIKKLKQVTENRELINKYLQDTTDLDEITAMLKYNLESCCLKSKCFDKFKTEEDLYLNLLENSTLEDGMFECTKCKSRKIFTTSKQTRRSDEATTVFATCSECKNKWVI